VWHHPERHNAFLHETIEGRNRAIIPSVSPSIRSLGRKFRGTHCLTAVVGWGGFTARKKISSFLKCPDKKT